LDPGRGESPSSASSARPTTSPDPSGLSRELIRVLVLRYVLAASPYPQQRGLDDPSEPGPLDRDIDPKKPKTHIDIDIDIDIDFDLDIDLRKPKRDLDPRTRDPILQ
jgi:hypothetical protein